MRRSRRTIPRRRRSRHRRRGGLLLEQRLLDARVPRRDREPQHVGPGPRVARRDLGDESQHGRRQDGQRGDHALQRGELLSASGLDLAPIKELGLLTAKPFIFVFNCDEGVLGSAERQAELQSSGGGGLPDEAPPPPEDDEEDMLAEALGTTTEAYDDEVPAGDVWVYCGSGYRASIAASLIESPDRTVILVDDQFDNAADDLTT